MLYEGDGLDDLKVIPTSNSYDSGLCSKVYFKNLLAHTTAIISSTNQKKKKDLSSFLSAQKGLSKLLLRYFEL